MPGWLHALAVTSVVLGFVCSGLIAVDIARRPQKMWIMNIVWPVNALFGTVLSLWLYFAWGRAPSPTEPNSSDGEPPFSIMVAKGAAHCGSGCTLGDIAAEWLALLFPAIAVWFGWHSIFADKIFAVWIIDYIFAFILGVAFQYFTIKPMRDLSVRRGLVEAVKADALSLTSWQIGMYGFMAFAHFFIFRRWLGVPLSVDTFEFWFMMQIAMLAGFASSYPVNWWLIKSGIKERM